MPCAISGMAWRLALLADYRQEAVLESRPEKGGQCLVWHELVVNDARPGLPTGVVRVVGPDSRLVRDEGREPACDLRERPGAAEQPTGAAARDFDAEVLIDRRDGAGRVSAANVRVEIDLLDVSGRDATRRGALDERVQGCRRHRAE